MAPKMNQVYKKKSGSSAPQRKRRNFLSSVLKGTCMYITSISTVMGCLHSRNWLITPRRLQSKSGAVRSMSFRQIPFNLDLALETRQNFTYRILIYTYGVINLFGLIMPCSGKINRRYSVWL